MIEILNSRDTQKVNEALRKYTNLKIISRDRGVQYQAINGNYIHVADRFHLLTNLSDWLICEIKRQLPSQYSLRNYESAQNGSLKINDPGIDVMSDATKRKLAMIEKARLLSDQGYSQRYIATILCIDRKTIRKYLQTNDIIKTASYVRNGTTSYLDEYIELITELCQQRKTIKVILQRLSESGINTRYSTLQNFIKNKIGPNMKHENAHSKITQYQIIQYVFSWSKNKNVAKHFDEIVEAYPFLESYKNFYDHFKKTLTSLDRNSMKSILNERYEDKIVNDFTKSLKQDSEAVLNAATYRISNGVTEGQVNKLKLIKRDMYGRASIGLLARKVIFQSQLTHETNLLCG
ncbi:transposase [Acetobacterium carbinolicum]|uniref:transposase n=1 Tax=Acetobacterium carbinolicum TaxID=52690 RepID=UPI0039BF9C96